MDPKFAYFYNALNCKVMKLCRKIEHQEKCIIVLKDKITELMDVLNEDQTKFNEFQKDVLEMECILNNTFSDDLIDENNTTECCDEKNV